MKELGLELYQLFAAIIEDRKQNPRDDLASVLANGVVDGQPMPPLETFGYYLITFTAGHDTTKNALAGGMRALVDNPDQLERVKRDPALVSGLVEEVVRWASPVNYMRRTAARDTTLRGQKIRAGRSPRALLRLGESRRGRSSTNRSGSGSIAIRTAISASGCGEHFCLGSHLARRSPARPLRRAGVAPRVGRTCRRARMDQVELRRRAEAPADPLPHRARRVIARARNREETWLLATP